MASMVAELRVRCSAGTADYTLGTVTYFSDDYMQAKLDERMTELVQVLLKPRSTLANGTLQYTQYEIPRDVGVWVEDDVTGSSFGRVYDQFGTTITSGITVSWAAGRVTFTTDQLGNPRYLDVRRFDIDQATASVWRAKASFLANNVDWASDNHRIAAGQEYQHCITMAEQYEGRRGMNSSKLVRTDMRDRPPLAKTRFTPEVLDARWRDG